MNLPAARLVLDRLAPPRTWRRLGWTAMAVVLSNAVWLSSSAACQSPAQPGEETVASGDTSESAVVDESAVPTGSADPLDLSFDDLKFDMETGADFKASMLTDSIKKLDGQRIRIRGFVRPGFKQSGIKNFVLVRDNQQCCFGPGAALYDCVMVKMAEDQAIDFSVRPLTIVGTMQLKKFVGKDGKVWAIFRLNDSHQE